MIHKQEAIENVLRLLVLLSLTNAGLPKKNFDYLRYVYVGLLNFLLFSFALLMHKALCSLLVNCFTTYEMYCSIICKWVDSVICLGAQFSF